MNQLQSAIAVNKQEVDIYLDNFLVQKMDDFGQIDSSLAELLKTISDQALRSGKRIRPFLVRQGYALAGGRNSNLAIQLGAGLELLHQYFLVHDDIVDRDEKRYGQDSLHEVWRKRFDSRFGKNDPHLGISFGLIGGDLLHSMAIDVVLQLPIPDAAKQSLVTKIHETIYATVAGWQIHFLMNHESIERVTKESYLKGMALVSAQYTFIDPLTMGLMLGENMSLLPALSTYGKMTGMAFQIRDDILGMFGDSDETGKPVGNDYREGKKTLLVLDAHQNGTIEQKKFLQATLGTNVDQTILSEVRDVIIHTGSLEASEKLARDYIIKAKQSLEGVDLHDDNQALLIELADFVIERAK